MKVKYLYLLLINLSLVFTLKAQQDAQFSQFMFNQQYYNAAYVGLDDRTNFGLTVRTQWLGRESDFGDGGAAPNTQVFTFSTALPKFNTGIGVNVVRDGLGPLTNYELQLALAHYVKFKDKSRLSFGIRTGIYSQIIDFDRFRFRQDLDVFDISSRESSFNPDLSAGLYYQSDKIFVGASINHFLKTNFEVSTSGEVQAGGGPVAVTGEPLFTHSYLIGGYNYEINPDWMLTPTFLAKYDFNELSIDIGSLVTYREKIWAGLTFRNEESLNVLVGTIIERKSNKKQVFRIGYSFDYVFLGQEAKQPTSHELTLSYSLPVPKPKYPAIIRTPRFRY